MEAVRSKEVKRLVDDSSHRELAKSIGINQQR